MKVNNIVFSIDSKIILNNISFSLNTNDKVGLVGRNGAGKSTLLKALSGIINIDSGNINLNHETIGYLNQEIDHKYDNLTILEYIKLITGINKLEDRLHYLEQNLDDKNMDDYSNVLNLYLSIDGYNFEDNLNGIISGLKLSESLDTKIKILSGGERIKVLLAALLLQNSDILLLDEPTNNLDLAAILWLENYLKNSSKKMIIVSHDETFLQNVTNKIFELENGLLREYNMKYDLYLKVKEIEYNRKFEEHTKLVEKKDKLKKQLQQAKEWASKGNNKKAHNDNDKIANNFAKERTNNSNVAKLSKSLEQINIPNFEEKAKINISFDFDNSKGNKDIILNNLICGYDTFKTPSINLNIPFGTRVQITGSNGSGKTTLIKTVLQEIKPISGKIIFGKDVKIGYISQDTLCTNTDKTILEYLKGEKEDYDLSLIFVLLDKFNISYNDKDKLYSLLSPGERTRVNLASLALNKINVLILDEVTNHLDKEAIDLIYELIADYQGTIISISHNRKFNEILNPNIIYDISKSKI